MNGQRAQSRAQGPSYGAAAVVRLEAQPECAAGPSWVTRHRRMSDGQRHRLFLYYTSGSCRINIPMPDEQPRASEKFRVFLDGEEILEGALTVTYTPRDGTLCTLDGKAMRILEVLSDEASGEIDEIYLEEVRE